LNCTNNILPQMLEMVAKEGDMKKGLWTSLKDWIGPNSFDEENKATRDRIPILQARWRWEASLRPWNSKLQKACFDDVKRHRFAFITRRAQALPLDDPRRLAFFGRFGDKFAGCSSWGLPTRWCLCNPKNSALQHSVPSAFL
jgi:hypothetical protein